jgi:hypothetical protein
MFPVLSRKEFEHKLLVARETGHIAGRIYAPLDRLICMARAEQPGWNRKEALEKADIDWVDGQGRSALAHALEAGRINNVITLLDWGATPKIGMLTRVVMYQYPFNAYKNWTIEPTMQESIQKTVILSAKHLICAGLEVTHVQALEFQLFVAKVKDLSDGIETMGVSNRLTSAFYLALDFHLAWGGTSRSPVNPFILFQKHHSEKDQREYELCERAVTHLDSLANFTDKVALLKKNKLLEVLNPFLSKDVAGIVAAYTATHFYLPLSEVEPGE